MAEHNDFGREGEDAALFYLARKGYTLLERNWRYRHLEIDIIAEWYGEIVFVEVKTRRNEDYAPALEAVTLYKKLCIIHAAREYIKEKKLQDNTYSYDIITVVGEHKPYTITHYINAFREEETWRQAHPRRRQFEV